MNLGQIKYLLLEIQAFDVNNDWNSKNKNQQPKGRWEEGIAVGSTRNQGKIYCFKQLILLHLTFCQLCL